MSKLLRSYLRLLAAFTVIAAIGHLAFTMRVGLASGWGFAPGWQREIGFWDLTMYLIIVLTLRSNDGQAGRTVALALVVLQLLAAINHMFAAIQTHAMLNTVLAVINFPCVILGILALLTQNVHRPALRGL